jgi:hypothetical protein
VEIPVEEYMETVFQNYLDFEKVRAEPGPARPPAPTEASDTPPRILNLANATVTHTFPPSLIGPGLVEYAVFLAEAKR